MFICVQPLNDYVAPRSSHSKKRASTRRELFEEPRDRHDVARRASAKTGERSTFEGERSNFEGERSNFEGERGKNSRSVVA